MLISLFDAASDTTANLVLGWIICHYIEFLVVGVQELGEGTGIFGDEKDLQELYFVIKLRKLSLGLRLIKIERRLERLIFSFQFIEVFCSYIFH